MGFTVALLVAVISLQGEQLEYAKLGVLAASALAALAAWIVFRVIERLPPRLIGMGRDRIAAAIIDLADPIDLDVDHVRGPKDAPVTLVEYGDTGH